MRRWLEGACLVALLAVAAGASCGTPTTVEPGDPVFELVTTGGFVGIYEAWVIQEDGDVVRGECRSSPCGWTEGALVGTIAPPELEALLDDLSDSDYFDTPDRGYGVDCCDQFVYTLTARTKSRARTVSGTPDRLPEAVRRVVVELGRRIREIQDG